MVRKVVATLAFATFAVAAGAAPALAAQPGPGDKQCIPGQQGNPHPAHKGGVCPNP